jgi:hypothetical protein
LYLGFLPIEGRIISFHLLPLVGWIVPFYLLPLEGRITSFNLLPLEGEDKGGGEVNFQKTFSCILNLN